MRIGGLATGMDIDQLVNKLMTAERMPLDRMEQDKTTLTWKRDSFRDMNKSLHDLNQLMLDMKLSKTYESKAVSSSNESAVTATANANASEGAYNINVENLATATVYMSGNVEDPDIELGENWKGTYTLEFNEKADEEPFSFEIKSGDSLRDVLKKITNGDNDVRAFYDDQQKKIIMESTLTGTLEKEISIKGQGKNGQSFFEQRMGMSGTEFTTKNGKEATFYYNGVELTSKNNSYELNGINFEFKGKGDASLTVKNDVDHTFDSIMKFVDTYNKTIDTLNESQQEDKYRDFPPLTSKQKEEMSEKEIELWEEKAKSGMLRGETLITNGMFDLRRSWYSEVKNDSQYTSVTEIGISTGRNYLNGGKLEVDEDKLKEALRENPQDVKKLFSNNVEGAERGIINRVEDAVKATMGKIEIRAGKGTSTLENYTLGKRMKDLNSRMSDFESKLTRVETRYWNEFTAMEKAIQRMNMQSQQLMSQFGGGM
ncbi:Flagellar hook-associated protein [Lentibacillus sp. JNUCC-1]|uniref:flagellar hook-associated protein 2 n=1 Tax=Lentibacillus sp. JNUCC-1 TaxID=2654513 RepID=UPI0012E9145C|nr:flagellar hook-associated protein 2 [Lentibacillus sp. JNUCC-1]MUV39062.1 Flagellar hook-associated protein [Lentibacillus sp. JNUCC-1]